MIKSINKTTIKAKPPPNPIPPSQLDSQPDIKTSPFLFIKEVKLKWVILPYALIRKMTLNV